MGKREAKRKEPNSQARSAMTLREESSGKKQQQQQQQQQQKPNLNAKTMCKLDHLKDLALWASNSEPSLAAFFGQRLAATTEALGLRADPSLFLCQRCESILQPGHNCTVRIEKNKSKLRHRCKKYTVSAQNNVVYKCHFCAHRNLMRGTPKGYVKDISPPKAKPPLKPNFVKSVVDKQINLPIVTTMAEVGNVDNVALPVISGQNPEPAESPLKLQSGLSLLDSKKRKRNRSNAKKVAEPESSLNAEVEISSHLSSKRKKKSWTSLKEIAQRSEHDTGKKFTNLTIPFVI